MEEKRLKTVGVKELKNNLSAYLRDVRNGWSVLISDRNQVIAELRLPIAQSAFEEKLSSRLLEWVNQKLVTLPIRNKSDLPNSPVCLPEGFSSKLLDMERGE